MKIEIEVSEEQLHCQHGFPLHEAGLKPCKHCGLSWYVFLLLPEIAKQEVRK